jgi:exopolysaccharide production protein ExoZ
MVVFHHVQDQSEGFRQIVSTQAGQAGVDLFFVISGFVMVYVTHDREQSPGQFLAMRAARIVPEEVWTALAESEAAS